MGQIKRDCPHCFTKNSAFVVFGEVQRSQQLQFTVAFYCAGCSGGRVAIIRQDGSGKSPLNYPGDLDAAHIFVILEEYPIIETHEAPRHLPDSINGFFLQAARSLEGRNYDAAGMMCRKVLDIAVKRLKPDASGKLFQRIESLAQEGLITVDLKDWAHIIRDDGNDAAHEEEPTTPAKAKELLDFTELFLMYTFTMPGMVGERKQPRDEEGNIVEPAS